MGRVYSYTPPRSFGGCAVKAQQLVGLGILAGAVYLLWNTSLFPSIAGALGLNTQTWQPLPAGYNPSAPVGPTQNYVQTGTPNSTFVGPALPAGCDPISGCPA